MQWLKQRPRSKLIWKAAEERRSYAGGQVPGCEPQGETSWGRVRERATRGRRSKISEVQNQISVRLLLAEVRITQLRDIRASASANSRPMSLTCLSCGSRSKC